MRRRAAGCRTNNPHQQGHDAAKGDIHCTEAGETFEAKHEKRFQQQRRHGHKQCGRPDLVEPRWTPWRKFAGQPQAIKQHQQRHRRQFEQRYGKVAQVGS